LTVDSALFLADLEATPMWLDQLADILDDAPLWQLAFRPERVVLIGMGSSLYAAQVAALRLRAAGITAIAESGSSVATLPSLSDDFVVGISAGGTSPETNRLFKQCAEAHRVALTNTPGSAITQLADATVDLAAGPELGGVACRSFTHTTVALLALEHALTGNLPDLSATVRRAAEASDDLLSRRADWLAEVAGLLAGPNGSWLLAPAERQSSAMQGALMLREGPRRPAVGCETGDWSHVEVYLTKTLDYRTLVFPGSMWDAQAADWTQQRVSTVVSVGGDFPGARFVLRYPGDTDPLVALLTETLVPELVAASLWSAAAAD
jgi:glutamine---fructose-6-phosphate transaminase (isomerizing)